MRKRTKQIKTIEVPKRFELDELAALKKGIVVESVGSENMYFEYLNNLGHACKGFYKF